MSAGETKCEAEGCQRERKSRAGTLRVCLMHYKRWKRHGDVNVQVRRFSPPNPDKTVCAHSDCGLLVDGASAWCKMHDTRFRRHGDPSVMIEHSHRDLPKGERNPMWAGANISYSGMHNRVRRARGPASNQRCQDCGRAAAHWSYDRTDGAEISSELGPFSLDVTRYTARCVPCHKVFDLSAIKEAG